MKKLTALGAAIALFWFGNAQATFKDFAEDTLMWDAAETELKGNPNGSTEWQSDETTFFYKVEEGEGGTAHASQWKYTYELVVPNKSISHLLIEVSSTFEDDNIISGSESTNTMPETADVSRTQPEKQKANSGNPGMPEDVFGIKWDLEDQNDLEGQGDPEDEFTFFSTSFRTERDPIWGDFYSKDGKTSGPDGEDIFIMNTGFTSPDSDPDIQQSRFNPASADFDSTNERVQRHILVPDTTTNGGGPPQQVPEPGTLVLLGLGLLGMQALLLRRRMGQPSPSL